MTLLVLLSLVLSSTAAPSASNEHQTTSVSDNTLAEHVSQTIAPQVSTSAPGDISTSRRKDEAPLELFPPHLNKDVPRLTAAGYKTLKFQILFAERDGKCPNAIDWFYKKNGGELTSKIAHVENCESYVEIIDLTEDTVYEVKARPFSRTSTENGSTEERWYNNSSSNQGSTESVTGLTCSSQVPPVEDLLVHSVGQRWLAVSWIPPTSSCLTRFQYNICIDGNKTWSQKGSFSTASPWDVNGEVRQCVAWPERHCLFIRDVDPDTVVVEVKVNRTVDGVDSKSVTVKVNTTRLAPEAPMGLHRVRAQPKALQLRWRCPLRPGGHLAYALVRVVDDQNKIVHNNAIGVTLRPRYDYTVNGLTPGNYTVYVHFNTTVDERGDEAVLKVCTPLESSPDDSCSSPALYPQSRKEAMQSVRADSGGSVKVWVLVFGICISICTGILVTVMFYARRRLSSCGWLILTQDDDNCSAGSKSIDRRNDAGRCMAAGPQPSDSSPSPAQGQTHVVLSTDRPWAAGLRSPGHDYEELTGNARFAPKPSAVRGGGDVYTELQGLAAQPAAPASKPMPVYAQVDKKRSLPPPPQRPPPVHRPPLQDSD